MLYLKASTDIQLLEEYNGTTGRFARTFGISDKRNKNGWRAVWEGIKNYIHTFKDKPGIYFVKCDGTECDLDHTEGVTKEQSLSIQEDFRESNIIDFVINEDTHTVDFIHEILTDSLWEKLNNHEIKGVSPSIWPRAGAIEVVGEMPNGLPMLDVYEWDALHDAFVNNPAFGDEAKIRGLCEGKDCQMRLLTAKQLSAASKDDCLNKWISELSEQHKNWNQDKIIAVAFSKCRAKASNADLAPLQEIPLLVKHKGELTFVSVDRETYAMVKANIENDLALNEENLKRTIRQHEEKLAQHNEKPNISFSACTCSKNRMTPEEEKEMKSKLKSNEEKVKELESKLKANEDEKKELEAKLKAQSEQDDSEKVKEAKQAQDKAEEEAEKAKKAKKATDDENKELKAKLAEPMIEQMLKARESRGASEEQIENFKKQLSAKSYEQIVEKFNDEELFLSSLSASDDTSEKTHFSWNAADQDGPSALSAKSLESIFEEEKVNA